MLPRLHLVTDATVLRAPGFLERAAAVLDAHGAAVAVHLRGHGLGGGELFRIGEALATRAEATGAFLLVNDRIDVALAVGANGVQLGRRSLPVDVARRVLGGAVTIGYSAHDAEEAGRAVDDGADFVFFGTVYPSATHPGETPAGVPGLRAATAAVSRPVLAIGGITPDRVREVMAAGAYGVAVLGGVWHADGPADAVGLYRVALEEGLR